MKQWMFQSWLEDNNEQLELARSQAILIGSFTNPEAAKEMIKNQSPDFSSTDEEFDRISEAIVKAREDEEKKIEQPKRRKRRKVIKD